ncbi:RpiB/LacA/LacB family sugar-phosphate isomerase [Spiroplasma endosymbiont of Nebria brevicollis]|uniref:RpiB/LacA/LacB family sugar-phosphate isomerase n=1 Tax=Spiroplasma endosymbiont of Nebria brevicollis TaxID=3066284 RepID=UPI00313BB501
MKIAIGALDVSKEYYEEIVKFIEKKLKLTVYLKFIDKNVVKVNKKINSLLENKTVDLAVMIEPFGIVSFMIGSKNKNVICAQACDELTAIMTKRHNNSNLLIIASAITGLEMAKQISKNFLTTPYDGGRHQVRVDMLNSLLEGE